MAQAVKNKGFTITTVYEPKASAAQARTRQGRLKKPARQWRDGLAWTAKLALLDSRQTLLPPYDVTVNGYFPAQTQDELPRPHEWFEAITGALSEALDVEEEQIRVKPGHVGYAPTFSPPHFEIVVEEETEETPRDGRVVCPACGGEWRLTPAADDDDLCPHCGQEDAGLPYLLGMV